MIAAMANLLGYDIYDLELTEVHSNSELRKLLMKTSSKSIIVIEDIDCSVNLSNRSKAPQASSPRRHYDPSAPEAAQGGEDGNNNTITLSGMLNFTDGLWSCCRSERIFVFTTKHIDKLDPACSGILLRNYLGSEAKNLGEAVARSLWEAVEKAKMTPADISEVLIKNRRNKEKAVSELLEVLQARAERNEKYGGLREECGLNGVVEEEEEEEQEKRVPGRPREGSEVRTLSARKGRMKRRRQN
ncbi:hypothetical protein NL676_034633 [Syzygium grande]|nr:hypothetical protein NL676_034633 [Syzygium grande]